MIPIRIASILVTAILAAGADDSEAIRSVLRGFNEATRKLEPQSFRILFWSEADYRDAERSLKGPDALVSLFMNRQVWSEQTPPILQHETIRFVAPSVAFVDAQFVQ